MTYTTTEPITVDGVRLDTLAYAVELVDGIRRTPGARASSTVLPGVHGVVPNLDADVFESTEFVINMWVVGSDEDGAVPSGSTPTSLAEGNIDALFHLFAARRRLLDVRRTMPDGSVRQALCRVVGAINPNSINKSDKAFRMSVALEVPSAFWQDVSDATFTGVRGATQGAQEVTTLTGGTAPITDAVTVVHGPANKPRVTDVNTGAYVEYNGVLAAGQDWRIDSGTWESVVGNDIGFDGTGTSVITQTTYDGGGAWLLPFEPTRVAPLMQASRQVSAKLTGSGFGTSTGIDVRARRKYL